MSVEVWLDEGSRWSWGYVEGSENGQPLELLGNKRYLTREEALRAATTAYPGVPALERDAPPGTRRRPRSRRWLLAVLVLAVMLLARRRRVRRR